jgi:hypothetical protein
VIETALGAELTGHLATRPGRRPLAAPATFATGRPLRRSGPSSARSRSRRLGTARGALSLSSSPSARPAWPVSTTGCLTSMPAGFRDIAAHLSGLYDVEVGRDTISWVTDAVLEDVAAWRTRPLEAVYPIVYFDAMVRHEALSDRAGCETPPLGCRSSPVKLRAA